VPESLERKGVYLLKETRVGIIVVEGHLHDQVNVS
jgi:hypothetical protein